MSFNGYILNEREGWCDNDGGLFQDEGELVIGIRVIRQEYVI